MAAQPVQRGFARTYLLPALWLFALPAFSLWFGQHVTASYDADIAASMLGGLDASAGAQVQEGARAWLAQNPPSSLCASSDPTTAAVREQLSEVCGDYLQFRMIRLAAGFSLGLGGVTVLVVAGCTLLATGSQRRQILGFRLGSGFLRGASAAQAVLQGALALALSFWITAFWFHVYILKLIFVIGLLAVVAVYNIVRSIFSAPDLTVPVEGRDLREADAPELWSRVRTLATAAGTEPPTTIVAGIDDNFFVTEGALLVGGAPREGRTLYLSLSLLRILSRDEADAVIAHEMAHFSGGDTAHGKRLRPLLANYELYLRALAQGGLTLPVFYSAMAFYGLFQRASARSGRERELRADRAAADLTSARDIGAALVKVGAYASYRRRVEKGLFEAQQRLQELGIGARVQAGFASYAQSPDLASDLVQSRIPHPFDSHPPLLERLGAVGAGLPREGFAEVLLTPSPSSWAETIRDGEAIEADLWSAYEGRFAAAHEADLAVRYEPRTSEERAIVVQHYPPLAFPDKKGTVLVNLDHEGIDCVGWEEKILFDRVKRAVLSEQAFRRGLYLELHGARVLRRIQVKVPTTELRGGEAPFLAAFQRYYGRHLAMRAWAAKQGGAGSNGASSLSG